MMSQITPYAIDNIGWRTFLMFAIFNFAIVVYSFFVVRETAGRSLEEMEVVFGNVASLPTKDVDVEHGNTASAERPKEIHIHEDAK